MPAPDPYDYPAELLALQGKTKIFQLHFDPESTKDKQVFILDTCWDDIPLLPSNVAALPESAAGSSVQKTLPPIATQIKSETARAPLPEPSTPSTEKVTTPDTFEPSEADNTPPPKETPLSEMSKPKNERPKRSASRALFTEANAQGTASHKKSKKMDE